MNKAVIYCRVSTKRQKEEGDGLASQATRCYEFAKYRNLKVIKTFEDAKTGALINRPAMQEMLRYLRKHRRENLTVIIDDISRLARGVQAHIELRTAIAATGAVLASPSIEFGEDPDSILVENLLASVSQHHRQKNAEQVRHRRRSRMLNGYWVHFAPRGYSYIEAKEGGKILVRDEPLASIIAEGLEGYASGRFQLKAEVKRFWENFPAFPKNRKGTITNEEVNRILSRVVYAGYIQSDIMNVSLRQAKHPPLISLQTWQKIQQRMLEKPKTPARKDLSEDFPLRGACLCAECDKPLTACWSKGRNKHYAYYYCYNKACSASGDAIKREVLEAEFEALVQRLRPSASLHKAASAMISTWWGYRHEQLQALQQQIKKEVRALNQQIEQIMDRLLTTDSMTLVNNYEGRIKKLETQKAVLNEKAAATPQKLRSYDESVRTVMDFLSNPYQLWATGRMQDRQTLLKLAFPKGLRYCRNEGLRTAGIPLVFKVFGGSDTPENELAEREGFEPSVRLDTVHSLSRRARSTAPAPLRADLTVCRSGNRTL
ncbi:MAG: hypothetical protein Tsb002_03500 [Wenzhouxiangellaceae bacterium]